MEESLVCLTSQSRPGDSQDPSLFFSSDPTKRVDFVIVFETGKSENNDEQRSVLQRRRIFQENLLKEGLEIENDEGAFGLNFLKIHAPLEVLKRYAEILKIRMPIRKFSAELLASQGSKQGAEGADMLELKLTKLDGSTGNLEPVRIPLFSEVAEDIKSWFERLQEPLYPSQEIIRNSQSCEYTAIYSRDKEYLFDHDKEKFFSQSTRSRIIEFLLKRKRFSEDPSDDFAFGINRLISDGVYLAAYPLHDGSIKTAGSMRHLLYREWASITKFWKYQPLDAIRDYFGVKIGLYFAWLGFYTFMLIPPSLVGLICFLYGLITVAEDTPSDEICSGGAMSNTTMCPICDVCNTWKLNETCTVSKAKYLFDNGTTVFFAVFMSLWAVFFLEFWKRYSAEITHRWDVFGYDPEEEHPRPEYLVQLRNVETKTLNFITQTSEPKPPFWKMKLPGVLISWSTVLMLILLAVAAVFAVILYRMSMIVSQNRFTDSVIKGNYSLFISMTGAGINLILILIFNWIYERMAYWLTEKELRRTQTEFDDSLTVKIYLFQFVNYYFSIFYIAFIKGQYIGRPGHYIRYFGYRQEECAPGGCFMELCIQLGIIFFGKQFLMSVMEYYMPIFWKIFNLLKLGHWHARDKQSEGHVPQYVRDFKLVEWGHQGLFYEYLEMVIQYGFITIFVCAFPLAPLLAFLNNILEMRLDAKKLLVLHRRPVAQKVRDIGVWFDILETLGRIAVITNAFIIAFTSEFIPKMVYRLFYSSDGSLKGYVDFTLSYYDQSEGGGNSSDLCRYQDYNHPPWHQTKRYQRSEVFFHIMFAKLLFVVLFENVVAVTIMTVRLIIPDMSSALKYRIRREAYITKEIIIRTERMKKLHRVESAPTITDNPLAGAEHVSRKEGQRSFTDDDLSPSSTAGWDFPRLRPNRGDSVDI